MGQCGCRDFHPDYALKGPDGSVLCLQVDPGCPDCHDHKVGLVVQKLEGDAVRDWDANHLPEFPLQFSDGADFHEGVLVLLDPDHVAAELTEFIGAAFGVHQDHGDEFRDAVREAVRNAVFKTRKESTP